MDDSILRGAPDPVSYSPFPAVQRALDDAANGLAVEVGALAWAHVRAQEAAIQRYMEENAALRGYVGRVRRLAGAGMIDGGDPLRACADVLAVPIPGPGAVP